MKIPIIELFELALNMLIWHLFFCFYSQNRGDKKLAIPEYTVYKYFIIPKNIRLIVEWSPQNDKE
jgi:hypothetical protein